MNICVTNLPRETSEDALRYAFSAFGQVRFVNIVGDQTTGGVKALVSMPIEQEARTAISAMNGKNLGGRIVQAVGQPGRNILPIQETPAAPRRQVHGKARRDGRSRAGRAGRTGRGHGRAPRGKRRKS